MSSRWPVTGPGSVLTSDAVDEIVWSRKVDRGAGQRRRAALRRIDRLRGAGHPAHPDRAARPAAAQPDPLARGRLRRRGRARGGPRADAAAAVDAGHRAHRRAPGDRAGLRRAAQRRDHPGRARVRLAGLLRRPGAAGALRPGRDGRGRGPRRVRHPDAGRRGAGRRRASSRSCSPRRRAWPSSTAPTACSACSCWPATTCALLLRTADIAAAMSVEAQLGTDAVFAADLQALRPHPGQADSAANLRALLADSQIMASHRGPDCTQVQDAYSLRCSPQVHGAVRDTVAHAELVAVPRAGQRDRQPGGHAGRTGREQRQLPRRARRLRAGLPGDRRRRPGLDRRSAAPTGSSTWPATTG